MRVQIVDPAAQTPPYDRSLAAALARAGADVELVTSHFIHGPVARADGYEVTESFYPRSSRLPGGSTSRRLLGLAEHLPGMLRHRRAAASADVVHYQWLTLPRLDARLLPPGPARVLTAHGFLRSAETRGPSGARRLLERMDAVVAHSEYGARRLREEAMVPAERVEVIPHGAFDYLTRLPQEQALPAELEGANGPVVLSFGLIRPYKGVDVLLRAFARLDDADAELWVVGRPLGVDLAELEELATRAAGRVRFVTRFVADAELPAIFRRADLVALPYRDAEQSGVLFTAIAFGKTIVASAVGGFPEVATAADGQPALRLVPPEDDVALAEALAALLDDQGAREGLAAAAAAAAAGPYSWDAIARSTLALYERLR